jgi:HEAT repeat protein
MKIENKKENLKRLQKNILDEDATSLNKILLSLFKDGVDKDFTPLLLILIDSKWHTFEEDIVSLLEEVADPRATEKLYQIAVNIPDYDDMRALAKKCMWALRAINTKESIEKLTTLKNHNDEIISENAVFMLQNLIK